MKKNQVLLVDGMALLFRGFFATSFRGNFMLTSKGVPTNGIYQFLRYLLDAVDKFEPTHVVCCWDMGSKTFRTEMYAGYKANRDEPPVELVPQFDLVKEVVAAFDIPNIGLESFEADDCIGTLARSYANEENDVLILTGDQDILQLVDDGIHVAIMRKGQGNYEVFTMDNFYDKKGIHPKQIIDLKGLMGDTSDNYPGVKGIGEKTALKLLQEYETIDQLLANMDQLSKGIQTKINNDLEMLHLSRELAGIKCDVPIQCSLDEAIWNMNETKVQEKFAELDFGHMNKLLKVMA
ncbi:5'-3' exonuclease [Bacilli bacterium]|uniref:5'-3' exonuclease n=1 Tax=Oceanobacillus TaxID=182709 RepID=UPI0006225016|nr:5'-3' exonuclease [Oceanobacillus caeni]KKE77963.1 5'-3' exonuclease [Bacilli bacterium VT-13-104]PZD84038.1 5'-3' exonuclease [Bacilli bacterium]MBU8792016.1 5'-3' exonuclease [Oceanobacillus caeni]PZD85363.1 5'-3' exonuclease [Bacilli bacterium]PZD85909.1 5'-3' exonuclease [Bacilli bacterium]